MTARNNKIDFEIPLKTLFVQNGTNLRRVCNGMQLPYPNGPYMRMRARTLTQEEAQRLVSFVDPSKKVIVEGGKAAIR